jgi:hypothetical protein
MIASQQQHLPAGGSLAGQQSQTQQAAAVNDSTVSPAGTSAAASEAGEPLGQPSSHAIMQHITEAEAEWQKQVGTGRWRLVQQHSSSMHPLPVPSDGASDGAGNGSATQTAAGGLSAAAAAAALVEELASAAQGLLPPLQTRGGTAGAMQLAASSGVAAEGGVASAGVQQQMQGAVAHSKQLLKVLCGVMQAEVRGFVRLHVTISLF